MDCRRPVVLCLWSLLTAGLVCSTGCDKIQQAANQVQPTSDPSPPPEQAVLNGQEQSSPAPEMTPPAPRTAEQIIAEFLALKSHEITDDRLAEVAGLESGLEQFTKLDLSSSSVTNAAMSSIAKLTELEELNISRTKIDNTGITAITELKKLRSLSIDATAIDKPGLAVISMVTTLEHLDARELSATDNIFEHLADMENLQVLHLDGNKNMQGKLFAEAVKKNRFKNLKELTASGSEFGYYGFETIGMLKGLETLRASGCKLADASVATVSGCVNLKTLDLGNNPLSSNIVPVIAKLRNLESLDLGSTGLNDEGLAKMKGLKGLKTLNVSETQCTPDAVSTLKSKFLKETEIRFGGKVF